MGCLLALVAALGLVGCSAGTQDDADTPANGRSTSPHDPTPQDHTAGSSKPPMAGGSATPAGPPSTQAPTPTLTAKRAHPVSLPALMRSEYDGRGLRLGEVITRTDAYTQRYVTYRSGDLTISGIVNRPHGPGPFPVLVLAHGYIDPAVYANGQGLRREQDWLARAGYAVLHTDYRNHAGSDAPSGTERRLRLGYTEDVINAVLAVRRSGPDWLDGTWVGLLGRSMGGGVVYNVLVTKPGLVDAAVVFAPVSSDTVDNFDRWIRGERDGLAADITDAYGSPEDNPTFWRNVSPRTYFDRVTEPVLIHHGTADESCPIRWSRRTRDALRRAGVDVRMHTYPGEPHAFIDAWPTSMRRTVRFFEQHIER